MTDLERTQLLLAVAYVKPEALTDAVLKEYVNKIGNESKERLKSLKNLVDRLKIILENNETIR